MPRVLKMAGSMSARPERFGAIVRLEEPPALVSIDRVMAARIGVQGGALWGDEDPGLGVPMLTAPTEAHVAVTERCPMGCKACYADATPRGHEPTREALEARLDTLARKGVFHVAFGGGEASLYRELPEVIRRARSLGLVPTMTTSGVGITLEKAEALREAGLAQANVSYDGPASLYESVRGYDGAAMAEGAIDALRRAGVAVGLNTVLTRRTFPFLREIGERAQELGAVELQLLRLKPSGRGQLDYLAMRLDADQIARVPRDLASLARGLELAIRVDCALLPFVVGDGDVAPASVARFGVMGCEAGRSLMTVRATGEVSPCSFWGEAAASPLDPEGAAWDRDSTLEGFRAYADAPPEPCASCPYRRTCRGGCRVVARALVGTPWAPDPECPRVRAHAQKLPNDAT
jgi:radical SAM protein with 4Fe4S-binding SPASM domain